MPGEYGIIMGKEGRQKATKLSSAGKGVHYGPGLGKVRAAPGRRKVRCARPLP